MRYDQNIDTPTQDLLVDSLIELGPNVNSIKVKRLIFQQPPSPVQGILFESDSLKISAEEIHSEGVLRWKFANMPLIAKLTRPATPNPQPTAVAGSDNQDSPNRHGGAGASGINGANGANGQQGKSGPVVTILCDRMQGYLAIDIRGTKGQAGQDGGNGGQGGRGHGGIFSCHTEAEDGGSAGRGGNGGRGGDGGKGGNGGAVSIFFTTDFSALIDAVTDGGEGGMAGNVGIGGPPGSPGRGGDGDNACSDRFESGMGSSNSHGAPGISAGKFIGRGDQGPFAIRKTSGEQISLIRETQSVQIAEDYQAKRPYRTFKKGIHISFKVLTGLLILLTSLHAKDSLQLSSIKASNPKPEPDPTIQNIIGYGSTIYQKDLFAPSRYIPSSSRVSIAGTPVVLGQGYDSLSGQFRGMGVLKGSINVNPGPPPPDGQAIDYHFDYIKNSTDLRRTLNINASGSLNIGLFSASAEMNMFKEHTENACSSYLVIRARVVNSVQRLEKYEMSSASLSLLKDPSGFVRSYGDQFVTGIITGGEFLGIVELEFNSVSDKEQFNGQLDASYGFFGSLSVSVDAAVKKSVQKLRVSASLLRIGGITQPAFVEYDPATFDIVWKKIDANMTAMSKAFIDDVRSHPVIIEVTTCDYNVCDNISRTGYNAPTLSFAKWYYDLFAAAVEKQRALIQADPNAQTIAEKLPVKTKQALRFMSEPVIFDASAEHIYSYSNNNGQKSKSILNKIDAAVKDPEVYNDYVTVASPTDLLGLTQSETKPFDKFKGDY